MVNTENRIFLIDFDSTFITHEGLDEFATIVLAGNKDKDKILAKFKTITKQGMEGILPFDVSLKRRVRLLKANKSQIEKVVKKLKRVITPSIRRNKKFFTDYKNRIYVISGGFKEFIIPVVKQFGIDENQVFENTFTYNKSGNITGFDKTNVLATEKGKTKLVKSLNLKGDLFVIGDGATDFQIKKAGLAKKFIAFTENTTRLQVVKNADHVAPTFDEFLYMNNLPMTVSYPKNRIKVVLFENIKLVAEIANFAIFLSFFSVNSAAIILRYKDKRKRSFRIPLNIGKFPVLSLLGAIFSIFMISRIPLLVNIYGISILLIGILLYYLIRE